MRRSNEVCQVECATRHIAQRAQVAQRKLTVAKAHRETLAIERAQCLAIAQASLRALDAVYERPQSVDRRALFAMLHTTGQWRLRWREALGRADMLLGELQDADAKVDACLLAAIAARQRVERFEQWLNKAHRAARVRADQRMQDQIEDIAWTFCME